MKKISNKKALRNRKKKEAYNKFDQDNDGICKGCHQMKPGTHSHIIPISEAEELESVVENITWHCSECHLEWESHDLQRMSKLLDFESNMAYIKKIRPLYYNRLML